MTDEHFQQVDRLCDQIEEYQDENTALRRQVAELRQALEAICLLSAQELTDEEWEKIDSLLPEYEPDFSGGTTSYDMKIFDVIHKQARAALARVGGGEEEVTE